jgi:hypothetical protein
MPDLTVESCIILAIDAQGRNPKLSIQHFAKQFNIPRKTLQDKMAGRPSKANTHSSQSNLTIAEEDVIILRIV